MWYWLIAAGLFFIGTIVQSLARRASPDTWAFRVKLRWALRVHMVLVLCAVFGAALVALLASTYTLPVVGGPSDSPMETTGAAFALVMAGFVLHSWFKYGDLLITADGVRMFHVFISWSKVTRLRVDGSNLEIWTKGHRRSWNAWTGKALLPLWPWHSSRSTAVRIEEAYREYRQGGAGEQQQ